MKKKEKYKNRGNIKWGVVHPNKNGAKSSKDRYYNDIRDGNGVKDEYNNDIEDGTETKNGCDINMRDGNGTKDGYKNDIENRVSKYNKYRIDYNINKNKYHIIELFNNFN